MKALNQDIDAAKTPFSGGIQTLQVYDGRPAGSNLDIVTDNITTSTVFGVVQGKQAKEHSDLTWKAEDVELEMAGSQAKVGTFESVVTWTLTDAAYK